MYYCACRLYYVSPHNMSIKLYTLFIAVYFNTDFSSLYAVLKLLTRLMLYPMSNLHIMPAREYVIRKHL